MQEAYDNWSNIQEYNFQFDKREKIIKAIGILSTKQVNQKMKELFLDNPRRINIKLHSETHKGLSDEIQNSIA